MRNRQHDQSIPFDPEQDRKREPVQPATPDFVIDNFAGTSIRGGSLHGPFGLS